MKKKWIAYLLTAFMCLGIFTGCGESTGAETAESAAAESAAETGQEESTEESAAETETQEAAGEIEKLTDAAFSIELLEDGIKKVTDGDGRELILVPDELEAVPEEYADSIVIRTPVHNAVFLSSTQVCSFRSVDDPEVISNIGGVPGGAEAWADIPAIREGLENGSILNVGDGYTDPDYEQIAALEPGVVFVYTGSSPQPGVIEKLEELGLPYAVDNEYMENDYMARMEWMRFILTFFDADDQVDAVMKAAKKNIDDAKARIEGLDSPAVAVFSVFDGTVYATGDSGWLGSMIEDIGAKNVFSGAEGSLSAETAFERIKDADVIVYSSTPTYTNGMAAVEEEFPLITECKAYEEGQVYQYGDSYWNGIDETDVIACDMMAMLYPEVFADRELSYFVLLEK